MKKLLKRIRSFYNIIREKFENHFIAIFLITMIVTIFFVMGATWLYPSYYNVEVEQLIDEQQAVIEKQSRELMFITNELKLQIAYTERLKLNLDLNNIEYKRYSDFLNEDIFIYNELVDADYLYENELDIDVLLVKSRIKGDTFYGETTGN